jgi:acetyl esterase/lipase
MFPSALLDALVAYLSLLYPEPGSLHEAVPASEICFSGDSSGANICIALLQTVLELQRQSTDGKALVLWHGREQILPLPAALTTHSAFLDLTRSLPSEVTNLPFDILPDPNPGLFPSSSYLPSSIWPTSPPRHQVYAPTAMLTHPLVSPIMTRDWRGCTTRCWFSFGQECLADSSIAVARRMIEQDVPAYVDMYEGMPHDFTLMMPSSMPGKICFKKWATFMTQAVEQTYGQGDLSTKLVEVNGTERDVQLQELMQYTSLEEMREAMELRIEGWAEP